MVAAFAHEPADVEPADVEPSAEPVPQDQPQEAGTSARRSVSLQHAGSGVRAITPTLWRMNMQREERPKPQRDSLRSRSNEGRPGSRKHRRWAHSQDFIGSLRKAMRANGESCEGVDFENWEDRLLIKQEPSAFYKLMEAEGPKNALEVWAAAESARGRPRSRPRQRPQRTQAQVAEQNERAARQVFGDSWSYIVKNECSRDFLTDLEVKAVKAFSSQERPGGEDLQADSKEEKKVDNDVQNTGDQWNLLAHEQWLLSWDGSALTTKSGSAPADEIAIEGLDGVWRRTAHQFARVLGLHSESRQEAGAPGDGKVMVLRPPRRQVAGGRMWSAPMSLAGLLAAPAA